MGQRAEYTQTFHIPISTIDDLMDLCPKTTVQKEHFVKDNELLADH